VSDGWSRCSALLVRKVCGGVSMRRFAACWLRNSHVIWRLEHSEKLHRTESKFHRNLSPNRLVLVVFEVWAAECLRFLLFVDILFPLPRCSFRPPRYLRGAWIAVRNQMGKICMLSTSRTVGPFVVFVHIGSMFDGGPPGGLGSRREGTHPTALFISIWVLLC